MPVPALVYDGDCAFCTRSVGWLRTHMNVDVHVVAWQDADLASVGIAPEQAQRELLWVGRDGVVHGGAQAFGQALMSGQGSWTTVGWLLRVQPVRSLAAVVYRFIADRRHLMPGGGAACAVPANHPQQGNLRRGPTDDAAPADT